MPFVNVAISVPLHKTFTYSVRDEDVCRARPGMRVIVPFKKSERMGYIVEADTVPATTANIKEIISIPDNSPAISVKMLKLIRWISDYYCAPIGEVATAALPSLLNNVSEVGKVRKDKPLELNLDSFQKAQRVTLNDAQTGALKTIEELKDKNDFSVVLLHGVTGSGKTELYLRFIEKIRREGKDAILLVPEISLVPQLAGRLTSFFREPVAVYHSGLTEVQRLGQWKMVADGKAGIVVGTRSALFAPVSNLGAIIIDEEHDNSYKQEESPRYNARDSGVVRARIEKAMAILGSATPTLESQFNAKGGKYHYISIPNRHGAAKMPEVSIVDMRKEPKSRLLNPHLSIELMAHLKQELRSGHQAILFLNRRGYANFVICRDCGHTPACPNCSITLTYHKKIARLCCHYCGHQIAALDACPKCKGFDLAPAGSGTEMIEEAIRKEIPNARIARLDRDTVATEKKRREVLARMMRGEIDILIGTQMVTKGHDFPNVTLVGIISADQSISFPDFRSGERTYQILTQVSGRAGRDIRPGMVIIQTYNPEHLSIRSSLGQNLEEFIASELAARKDLLYPPFSRIANIRVSGNKEMQVRDASKKIAGFLAQEERGLILLGPAPAPLATLMGKIRWQLLVKSRSAKTLATALNALRNHLDNSRAHGVQIAIDVDPVTTM